MASCSQILGKALLLLVSQMPTSSCATRDLALSACYIVTQESIKGLALDSTLENRWAD